jgi:hypothetical protein
MPSHLVGCTGHRLRRDRRRRPGRPHDDVDKAAFTGSTEVAVMRFSETGPIKQGTSYDCVHMRISTALGGVGMGTGVALFPAHVVSWRSTCAVLVPLAAIVIYRLLAERGRRKTLEITYRFAPHDTVLVLGEGPGGPAMWIQVGGKQPGQPVSAGEQDTDITPAAETAGTR